MAGTRVSGVPSHDDQWLYSLYVRADGSAFIHALSLDSPLAFCIDLPGVASTTNGFHWSLALNGAGTHLYATNGATGIVTDLGVDNGVPGAPRATRLSINQSASVPAIKDVAAKAFGGNAAAISPDGKTLVMAGKTGVLWIDTATLDSTDRQLPSWNVWSLAISPDGATVYAINDAGMIAELPMSGAHQATTFGGAEGQPLDLIRVAAAS
jgi:DNA-binding beta-propeller fold protein YncE